MSIIRKDLGQRPPARLKSKLSVVQPGKAVPDIRLEVRSGGEFSLYSQAPDHMEPAMDRLAESAIERNIFQTPAFLLPALGERHSLLRVALMEDGDSDDSLTALMTFSVRGNGSHLLAHAIGDIGYHAPLISRNRPMATLDQLFEALAGSLVNLPGIAVFPHLLADGAFMRFARAVAAARGLAFRVTHARRRRALSGPINPAGAALTPGEREAWQANLAKWEALNARGKIGYHIARNPSETALMLDELSALTTTIAEDRSRFSALLPTAKKLGRNDQLRIHALYLSGEMIAAAIQPVTAGEAWIWQVFVRPDMEQEAVDEQLIMRLTEWNTRDANIAVTRAAPGVGPYLAERFWPVEEGYATLMVAIRPGMERAIDALAREHRD